MEARRVDAAVAGLIGTAIGALAGVIGSLVTGRQQYRAERARLRAGRLDELVKAERQALLHLTELQAAGAHEINWLAWAAMLRPDDVFRQAINSYDLRMHALLPRLLAAEAAAAGLSTEAFDRIGPLVDELQYLDGEVGTAAAGFDEDQDEARRRVAAFREQAISLADRTVVEVRALLRVSVEPDDQPSA